MSNDETTKSILKGVKIGAIVLFLVITLFNSFYRVNEQQSAVVTMFGKVLKTETAGLILRFPIYSR